MSRCFVEFILKIFDECGEIARQRGQAFMKQDSNDKFLDIEEKQQKINDERLYEVIQKILKGQSLGELQSMEKASRDKMIRKIKSIEGVTQRQIARVTGINQSLVFKASKQENHPKASGLALTQWLQSIFVV